MRAPPQITYLSRSLLTLPPPHPWLTELLQAMGCWNGVALDRYPQRAMEELSIAQFLAGLDLQVHPNPDPPNPTPNMEP